MNIKKPIFIIGSGRSGTTFFHELFCEHHRIAWFSTLLSVFPGKIFFNKLFLKLIDIPFLSFILKKIIKPTECYNFWEKHVRGFSSPFRDLIADDVTLKVQKKIPGLFSKTVTKRKNRLLIKITGWSRIGYLSKIFPDAYFIHIKRDAFATVNSFLNVYFWRGWQGPHNWRFGTLSEEDNKLWDKYNKSFVALAAIGYKILDRAIQDAKTTVPKSRFLEITYQELCSNPQDIFNKVLKFVDLDNSRKLQRKIKKKKIINMNHKWKKELTEEQIKILTEILPKNK